MKLSDLSNFNSHAHVERDRTWEDFDFTLNISTHTLTWSVTNASINNFTNFCISTHTLTWSVTTFVIYAVRFLKISTHTLTWSVTNYSENSNKSNYFNSHAHVERDG